MGKPRLGGPDLEGAVYAYECAGKIICIHHTITVTDTDTVLPDRGRLMCIYTSNKDFFFYKLILPVQLSNTYIFHFNLSKTYSTVQTMEYNRQLLVSTGSTGTGVHYSTPGQPQSTNNIVKTYDNYSHRQSNLSRGTVHQTMNSNKESSEAPRLLMNGTPKTHSITKVIDDHPYRPYFTKETFGTLTLNQKEARKQLTSQLYTGNTDNIMNNIL